MKKSILISLAALALTVLASPVVLAEEAGPGKDRAATSKPATAEEKAAAKTARRAEGKELAKKGEGRLEEPATPPAKTAKASKAEKDAARAKRRAEGKELGKQDAGRLEESAPGTKK